MQLIAYYFSNNSCCLSYCLEIVLSISAELKTLKVTQMRKRKDFLCCLNIGIIPFGLWVPGFFCDV